MLRTAVCFVPYAFAQSREASGTIGYDYQYSDQGHGERSNLNGFFASGQFDFSDDLSIVGDQALPMIRGQAPKSRA
jgi:hypothetical protein